MPKFRKKPVVVEAIQWTGDNFEELRQRDFHDAISHVKGTQLAITTENGWVFAEKGDWIVKGKGLFFYCKPDVFEANYEAAE